jgi:hypothetical protein
MLRSNSTSLSKSPSYSDIMKTFLLVCCIARALAAPAPQASSAPSSGNWTSSQCTDPAITDASTAPETRWSAVDCWHAWDDATKDWNNTAPGHVPLQFAAAVSNFFHGPEHMNCQDIHDTTCSAQIQCHDTNHPAGSVPSVDWNLLRKY